MSKPTRERKAKEAKAGKRKGPIQLTRKSKQFTTPEERKRGRAKNELRYPELLLRFHRTHLLPPYSHWFNQIQPKDRRR